MQYEQFLVETDWLAEHLDDLQLRIFDCTVLLAPPVRATGRPRHH